MKARFFLYLSFLLLLSRMGASACSCSRIEHACEAYNATPIIFSGTVVDLGGRETGSGRPGSYSQQIRFAVTEEFKGAADSNITLTRVHVQSSCASTTPDFIVAAQYLVWAYSDSERNIIPDCTPTMRLDDAAQFISELRQLRAGQGGTYIFGDVHRTRMFPNGTRMEDVENYSPVPLSGVRVSVSTPDTVHTVLTDQKGHFVLLLEHGGMYRVQASLSKFFEQDGLESSVNLATHGCADMSLWTRYSFPFQGRIVNTHGVPVAGVLVSLLSANTLESFAWATTDATGSYELSAWEPGDYLIAANWDEAPSETAPFPTMLYPGVHDLESATRLHTEESGPIALSSFRVAIPAKCSVQVRVQDQNGSPADAKVLSKYFPEQFWHPIAELDSSGTAIVPLFGPNVMIVASKDLPDGKALRSEEKLIKSCPAEPLSLRLTETVNLNE